LILECMVARHRFYTRVIDGSTGGSQVDLQSVNRIRGENRGGSTEFRPLTLDKETAEETCINHGPSAMKVP
jgi:hypothetical protein